MTHLGFIATAYALGAGVPIVFAVLAQRRLSAARRRLAVLDRRS